VFIALSVLLVLGGPAGALSLAGGWIACRGYGLWCRRRVGGITGDLLGAGGELIEALMLSVFALAGPELVRYAVWGRWPGF
jgi:cobalamin synthase